MVVMSDGLAPLLGVAPCWSCAREAQPTPGHLSVLRLIQSRSTPLPAIVIEPPANSTPVASTPDLSTAVHGPTVSCKAVTSSLHRASSYASINSANGIRTKQSPQKSDHPYKNAKPAQLLYPLACLYPSLSTTFIKQAVLWGYRLAL